MQTVIGLFTERSYANRTISKLQTWGYKAKNMAVIIQDISDKHVSEGAVFLVVVVKDKSEKKVEELFKNNFAEQLRVVH